MTSVNININNVTVNFKRDTVVKLSPCLCDCLFSLYCTNLLPGKTIDKKCISCLLVFCSTNLNYNLDEYMPIYVCTVKREITLASVFSHIHFVLLSN